MSTTWTRENLAWAAGLLEGEGCFHLAKRKGSETSLIMRIDMKLTDFDVMARLLAILRIGTIYGPFQNKQFPHRKPIWSFEAVRQNEVYAVCAALYPFMGDRRLAKIKLMMEAFKNHPTQSLLYRRASNKRWHPKGGNQLCLL